MVSVPALPACADGQSFTRSVPCARLADLRGLAGLEYRIALLRNASVPLGVVWGRELQLALGVESLVARLKGGDSAWAAGATIGITGVGDVLGAEPMLIGVTAGWPLSWDGLDEVALSPVPEIYIRWGQHF